MKFKKVLLSLGLLLAVFSCSSAKVATASVDNHMDTKEIVKNKVLEKTVVYKTYENGLGLTTIFKQTEKYEKGANHPISEISSVIYDQNLNEVDLSKTILTPERKAVLEKEMQKIVDKNEKKLFFKDAKVNLNDAVVVITDKTIVFLFPHYVLGPYSSGIIEFNFPINPVNK